MKSFEGYNKCEDDKICDVLTGNCIENTEENKIGRVTLEVEGLYYCW